MINLLYELLDYYWYFTKKGVFVLTKLGSNSQLCWSSCVILPKFENKKGRIFSLEIREFN